jgi:hypothetical protein
MKNAQNVPRIGLAKAGGSHLQAVNEVVVDERVGLMNPKFRYVKAAESDIRKTFARIRREQKEKKS